MKSPSEIIPKFIITLEKNKERANYVKDEVIPKLNNYFKCRAFDGEEDDPNSILEENKLFIADNFISKFTRGQLGCFISHFQIWKYLSNNNIEVAIILEDDVKLYKNFNRIIDVIYENLPVKFDYVHLFVHPDKLKLENLNGNDGDIIPAEENLGTVAYMISLKGARRLIKLTQLLKIQAPVDRQINSYIQHHFLKAYMVKKPFLITQGEIMPNRLIYEKGFKSTVWYSKKLSVDCPINKKYIRNAGFDDNEIEDLDREIDLHKNINTVLEAKQNKNEIKNEEENIIDLTPKGEDSDKKENASEVSEENVKKEMEKEVPEKEVDVEKDLKNELQKEENADSFIDLSPPNKPKAETTEEDEIVSAIIGRLKESGSE